MRAEVAEVQIKGLRVVALNEGDGGARLNIDPKSFRHGNPFAFWFQVATIQGEIRAIPAHFPPEIVVETLCARAVGEDVFPWDAPLLLRRGDQAREFPGHPFNATDIGFEVPFPQKPTAIPGGAEPFRKRDRLARQRDVGNRIDAVALLVTSGDDPGSGRRALRGGDITGGAAHAADRQQIEVGVFYILLDSLDSKVGPTHVVCEDDNDVRFGFGGSERADQQP